MPIIGLELELTEAKEAKKYPPNVWLIECGEPPVVKCESIRLHIVRFLKMCANAFFGGYCEEVSKLFF